MNLLQLRNGPLVREDALLLALALEAAGHEMRVTNGVLTVTNGSALTPEQRQQISAVKFHLMAIAAYEPPEAR